MLVLLAMVLTGCSPASAPTQGSQAQGQAPAPAAPKILVAALNEDPKNFWDGTNGGGGSGSRQIGHVVNQYLASIASDGTAYPRLLAELPSVEKGSWTVAADGKMEVTYKVRPGVTWHDGTPFTADDIAFSWEVCRDPEARNTALTGAGFNGNPLGGLSAVRRFATDQTPTAANKYAGTNRGHFSNPAWDDVGLRLRTALDDDTRIDLERELLQVFSADLPALAVQFELQPVAVTGFKGLIPITGTPHTGNIMHTWNVHEWEML